MTRECCVTNLYASKNLAKLSQGRNSPQQFWQVVFRRTYVVSLGDWENVL